MLLCILNMKIKQSNTKNTEVCRMVRKCHVCLPIDAKSGYTYRHDNWMAMLGEESYHLPPCGLKTIA